MSPTSPSLSPRMPSICSFKLTGALQNRLPLLKLGFLSVGLETKGHSPICIFEYFSVLYCTDSPDLTSTTGYESYDWNNEKIPNSVVTYKCPTGQAFDGKPMGNKCSRHDKKNSNVYSWKYSEEKDNLPDCVGRCCIRPNKLIDTIFSILCWWASSTASKCPHGNNRGH